MLHPCNPPLLPILVAEDLDDDFDTVVEAVRHANVPNPLVRVRTLAEALDAVTEGGDHTFVFVLLDVNLPDGPGADLVRAVRNEARFRTTPVVVFSTSDNPQDLREMYGSGINAYHVKALRHRENLDMLSSIFAYWLHSVCIDVPDRTP